MIENVLVRIDYLLNQFYRFSILAIPALALFSVFVTKLVFSSFASRYRKIKNQHLGNWDGLLLRLLERTKSWALFAIYISIYASAAGIHQPKLLEHAILLAVLFQCVIWGNVFILFWRDTYLLKRAAEDVSTAAAVGLLQFGAKVFLLVTLTLIGLSGFGVNIGALLAGLGIGGIAVALAAQNILGDLLASLSIVLDKPFVIGDFIVVGTEMGTVVYVGMKTTRIRSLSGEQIIFSNKDLLESRIRNFKRMEERRVVHRLGVTYNTTRAQLEKIPVITKQLIEAHERLRFERCFFTAYADSALIFELVFWVNTPDQDLYLTLQHQFLLDLYSKFKEEKIEFAYPTQTVYIQQQH